MIQRTEVTLLIEWDDELDHPSQWNWATITTSKVEVIDWKERP